ncbi:MAG: molybdopterin-dependent oxidoreductase [Ktedonobacterales bacterium]|nr:molybdopterin-dependent oxidoreductase [Ktedonobacterales bacterium]
MSDEARTQAAFTPPGAAPKEPPGARHLARRRYEAGVWSVPLALAPSFLLAALLGVPTPLEPLVEAVMQLTPVALANVVLEALGNFARTAALLGAIAICLPVGGLMALAAPDSPIDAPDGQQSDSLALRRARWATVAALALGVSVPLALGSAYAWEAVSALLAGALFLPALVLVRRAQARIVYPIRAAARAGDTSRRAFLRRAAGSVVTVAGAVALGTFDLWSGAIGAVVGRGETLRHLFAFTPPAPRQPGFPLAGEEPEVTPVARFYRISKNEADPQILPAEWSLRVTGAVNRPLTLSYADLLALPRVDAYVTLRCVDNPPAGHLMSNAYWSGVSLAALLERAGAHASAVGLVMRAPDAYDEIVPIAEARGPTALLAYGMNGATLPWKHGGPVRALVPGFYGFKNVKWVEALEVVTTATTGYWARRGWTAKYLHSIARIDVWHARAGGLEVGGVAFTGARGVSAVQVRVDGGAWQLARLNAPALALDAWVQWRVELSLAPGQHQLTARVIDGGGIPQDAASTNIYPDGSTGLHTVTVMV